MIDYDEEWLINILGRTAGSVSCRACCFALPATLITLALLLLDDYDPHIREESSFMDLGSSTIWNAMSALLVILVAYRARNANSRFWEGTGLLHQMRGEWFDTVSNCVTFSIKARHERPEEVMEFRHTLVRLMSLAHGNALEEVSDNQFELETIDPHGLDKGTLRHLKACHEHYKFNKVEVILHMIQSLITGAFHQGLIDIPAPILSRVYQTISRGFVNLLNTKKITDTKFPFPYVQLIAMLMFFFTVVTPLLVSSFIPNKFIAAVTTFVPVFAVASMNCIAIELENPFGLDDNDLPLHHFQVEMDSCLLMLLHPNADLVSGSSQHIIMDFETLVNGKNKDHKRLSFSDYRSESGKMDDCIDVDVKRKRKRFDSKLLGPDSIGIDEMRNEMEESVHSSAGPEDVSSYPSCSDLGDPMSATQDSVFWDDGGFRPPPLHEVNKGSKLSWGQPPPSPALASIQPLLERRTEEFSNRISEAFVKSLESLTKVLERQMDALNDNLMTTRKSAGDTARSLTSTEGSLSSWPERSRDKCTGLNPDKSRLTSHDLATRILQLEKQISSQPPNPPDTSGDVPGHLDFEEIGFRKL